MDRSTVHYFLDVSSGMLMREVTPGGSQPVAALTDFTASNRAEGRFQLNFSYMQGDIKVTRSHPVFLPMR